MSADLKFDEIGYWTEVKLDIVKDYASAYSRILSAQRNPAFCHVYIDAFAGSGYHVSKATGSFIVGSPLNALSVQPPFKEYHFIDLEKQKVQALREEVGQRQEVHIHEGDCNQLLLEKIFPCVCYEDYRRALCLLDPYGLNLNWNIVQKAGEMKSIEIFINFPVEAMNRNVLWRNREKVSQRQIERMNAFWGDNSWGQVAYKQASTLFGSVNEKASNENIAEGFRARLEKVAGFEYVPKPMAMRNSSNVIVYYLFFASYNHVGQKIVEEIFRKHSKQRGS